MNRSLRARIGHAAVLGLVVLAAFNAALLAHAWLGFVHARPDAFVGNWPTFSRALSLGDAQLQAWLAGIAGAGLLAGAAALALMQAERARAHAEARGTLWTSALLWVLIASLGVLHYLHVTVTLSMNNDLHMLTSYTFFFGMSGAILGELVCSLRLGRLLPAEALGRGHRARIACAQWLAAAGALFLLTFVLKDVASNPWAGVAQRVFVVAEAGWIVLAHAYGLLYVPAARAYFA